MAKIVSVKAGEILDSQGNLSVKVEIVLGTITSVGLWSLQECQ